MTYFLLVNPRTDEHAAFALGGVGEPHRRLPPLEGWPSRAAGRYEGPITGLYRDRAMAVVRTRPSELRPDESPPAAHRILVWTLGSDSPPRSIDLDDREPHALTSRDRELFIGLRGTVVVSNLGIDARPPTALVEVSGSGHKPFDHFRWDGDDLFALDNLVRPHFGAWLRVPSDGSPRRLERMFLLPTLANAHYLDFVIDRESDGSPIVFALVHQGVSTGHGHAVYRVDVAAQPPFDLRRSRALRDHPSIELVAEEFTPSEFARSYVSSAPPALTPWTALSITPRSRHLLLAAGNRGLLVSGRVQGDETMDSLDTGGACTDVLRIDERVFALVSTDDEASTAILEIDDREGLPRIGGSQTAEGRFGRFVR